MSYLALKQAHMLLAAISVTGFALRWFGRRSGAGFVTGRATRILPHLVDTLLLVAGIVLALRIAQYPLVHPWLTAKIAGLLIYIALGVVAMRSAPASARSTGAFCAALVVFGWMVSVARSKSAWGFFAGLVP